MIFLKNTQEGYGIVAIIFHWTMAVLIIFLLTLGIYMVNLPISLLKLKLFGWHKEWGILALILVSLRLGWRFNNIVPRLPDSISVWQKRAAHGMHWVFYICLFALPITGWMISSAANLSVSFFGLFILPDLIAPNPDLQKTLEWIHQWIGYALILFICLHIAAALKHHFINKDNVLRRMLPW